MAPSWMAVPYLVTAIVGLIAEDGAPLEKGLWVFYNVYGQISYFSIRSNQLASGCRDLLLLSKWQLFCMKTLVNTLASLFAVKCCFRRLVGKVEQGIEACSVHWCGFLKREEGHFHHDQVGGIGGGFDLIFFVGLYHTKAPTYLQRCF